VGAENLEVEEGDRGLDEADRQDACYHEGVVVLAAGKYVLMRGCKADD
jgi:hypothetical protein